MWRVGLYDRVVWRLGWDALTLIDPRERVCSQVGRALGPRDQKDL